MIWSILRFIAGVSSTAGIILAASFVMSCLKQHGFKAMFSIHFSGLGLGIAIPSLLIFSLSSYINWSQQWFVMGLFGLLFFLHAWFLMPQPVKQQTTDDLIKAPNKYRMRLMIATYACAGVGYVIRAILSLPYLKVCQICQAKAA